MPENEGGGECMCIKARQPLTNGVVSLASRQPVSQFSWRLQWTERDEWALNDGRRPLLFDRRKTFT